MQKKIGYKNIEWEDIKRSYYPIGLSERKQQEAILRKVQIDAGISQINKEKEHSQSAQIDAKTQRDNEMLKRIIETPSAFEKVLEVALKQNQQ